MMRVVVKRVARIAVATFVTRTAIGMFIVVCGLGGCTSGSGAPLPSCGSGQELTPNEKSRLCDELSAAGCQQVIQYDACLAEVDQFLAEFEGDCCAGAVVALYRCGLTNGFRCAEHSDDILFTPACAAVEEQFDECSGSSDNCTQSIGQGEWVVECDQYAADCSLGSPEIQCVCTFGPHTGTSFVVPDDDVLARVEASCK